MKRWFSNQTQVAWVCKALYDGRIISHKTEFREVKGWRLSAIVHRLRTEFDWPILVEYRGPDNVAHYRLAPDCDRSKLRFPRSAQALAQEGTE